MATETKNLVERPPVVVVMGHIDHGKSTLLDYIRKGNVVNSEAGGITQHIAAYEIVHDEKKVTFLDTPGHEAFCNVRSRGAKIADIAILIVSAEDGVMPQTKEAIECIKADNLPFIVAVNKIDSGKADVEKTKQSLMENEIYLEGFGGNTSFAGISAKTGEGIEDLLELILLTAEVEEFKADPQKEAEGFVVEAHKDVKRGVSATLIIKEGTLKKGMYVAGNTALSPVRSIENDKGERLDEISFSSPVIISGWNSLPPVGSLFKSFNTKKEAEEYCKNCDHSETINLSEINIPAEFKLPLILKTDVSGTLEAIVHELKKIQNEKAAFRIVRVGTGNIGETDIKTASGSDGGIVVGFNVGIDPQAEALRERDGVVTKTFNIIYELTDYLKETLEERRPREEVKETLGLAKILKTFSRSKDLNVLGGKIKEGKLVSGGKVSILRRDEVIGEGKIKELQQQKVKVDKIEDGEFGAAIESKIEIVEGDKIESFEMVEK